MKIIVVSQDEPFYLGKHLDYFFRKIPAWAKISGVIILKASPFGKAESFFKRAKNTYDVFGITFFSVYTFRFITSKIFMRKYLFKNILRKNVINEIKLPHKNLNARECLDLIQSLKPDLIISISANQIFGNDLIELPVHGCLNLHTAKLPQYKGLMPSFWALKNDEKEIGVSVFFMDKGIDTGDIIVQKIVPIRDDDTLESLINVTKKVGMDALILALTLIRSGEYKTKKFSADEGSYYSFPCRKDVKEFKRAGKKFW